ncbi:site-specific DNA-methyltransferase [archaeon]|nr:site-specific DNA-methyltransferase [archaeon]
MKDYDKASKEDLIREIEKLKQRKKYGLVWDAEKEPEKVVLDCRKNLPIFSEDKKRKIKGEVDEPNNFIIEGDNYHSLSALSYTHKEKIDVIYIDPPYNTGNSKEWKYNDIWIDAEDRWRHSKWLNFIEKRLKLGKRLLRKTGVIFISIDDHEFAQLKLLCDEIFGEDNFVDSIVWKKRYQGAKEKYHAAIHEYIFVYAKDKKSLQEFSIKTSPEFIDKYFKNKDENYELRGGYRTQPLEAGKSMDPRPNLVYPVQAPDGSEIMPKRQWVWGKERVENALEKGELDFKKNKSAKWSIRFKQYLKDETGVTRRTKPFSIIDDVYTQDGTKEINSILGDNVFKFPKPTKLIKKLLDISSGNGKDNITVLDFFAGSGTTGHAVMDLNKEDGGNRKFILCTNNEDNNNQGNKIAENICYPRLKKVIKGYSDNNKNKIEGFGGNLRYYKTNFVETENLDNATDQDKLELTRRAGEMIAVREETFEEVERDDWWQIFSNEKEVTAIYFKEDKGKLQKLVEKLDKMGKKINLYIFSWGKNEYVNEFAEYKKIKVKDIPEPLIDVYKEVANL